MFFALSLAVSSPAFAYDDGEDEAIGVPSYDNIEQQIEQQQIEDFAAPPPKMHMPKENRFQVPVSGSNMADLVARMTYLEEEMRKLNGQVAQLQFELKAAKKAAIAKPKPEEKTNDSSDKYVSRDGDEKPYVIKVGEDDLKTEPEVADEEKAIFDAALVQVSAQKLDDAKKQFAEFIKKFPESKNVADAYFWQGEISMDQSNYKDSALNYLKAYRADKAGKRAEESLLKSSIALGKLGKKEEACKSLTTLKTMEAAQEVIKSQATSEAIKLGCK